MVTLLSSNDQRLKQRSKQCTMAEAAKIIKDLRYIIKHAPWGNPVGMAAPQIGAFSRVFIAQDDVYINPTIIGRSERLYVAQEGCYSCTPHARYPAKRYEIITMKYTNEKGKRIVDSFNGFQAQVIQHEYDHLEGKKISDKVLKQ